MKKHGSIARYWLSLEVWFHMSARAAVIVFHGFLRAPDGTLSSFDAPNAATGFFFEGTAPDGIDAAGEITGVYTDVNGIFHGFLRAPDGTFTTLDAPGASSSTNCGFPGTEPSSINAEGDITGFYSDVNCQVHGFLRKTN
jgi:hypothetical protein